MGIFRRHVMGLKPHGSLAPLDRLPLFICPRNGDFYVKSERLVSCYLVTYARSARCEPAQDLAALVIPEKKIFIRSFLFGINPIRNNTN